MAAEASESETLVAQVVGSLGWGGVERMALNLAVALAHKGVPSLAVAVRKAEVASDDLPGAVTICELRAGRGAVPALWAMLRLRQLIKRENIGVLHVHGSGCLPLVVLATRAMRPRPKIVFAWQDSGQVLPKGGLTRRLAIWSAQRCDVLVGSSQQVADRLREGVGAERVGVLHAGVPARDVVKGPSSDLPLVFWCGRIVPPKDPLILAGVAAKLRSEGLRFQVCVAGKPAARTEWYWQELRSLVESSRLQDTVLTPGYVPDDRMYALMDQAEIGVQTSHTEGLSLALLEQMMAGLAIVATNVGDTAQAIEHEKTGLLIPPKNEEALAAALRRLLTDVPLRRRLGAAARERALARFSLSAMAHQAMEFYAAG